MRAYSPLVTIGGGTVLDPLPPRKGVRTPAGRARFASVAEQHDVLDAVAVMIEEAGLAGFPLAQLGARAGVRAEQQDGLIARLEQSGRATRFAAHLVSSAKLAAAQAAALAVLAEYHASHPLADGIPREELRERLFADAPLAVFEHALDQLQRGGKIAARDRVALTTHHLVLSDEDGRARAAIVRALSEAALTPPDYASLAAKIAMPAKAVERMTALLVRQKVVIRLGDLLFHEAALDRLKSELQSLKKAGTATIDVAAFKERFGVSRKYAIPLLEFLDRERVTRRAGETRQIL